MTDEQERALREYRAAADRVGRSSGKAAEGAEAEYSQAYQRCVRLGLFSQLRRKYR